MKSVASIGAVFVTTCLASNLFAQNQSPATESNRSFPWEGEVTGTNVYVRSGAGANWYPTAKLGAGARVLVLGEKFGWYQITPPPASFSYVEMAMVQRAADGKSGIVTDDRAYVRAGSEQNTQKSATQLVMNKGATVQIIGEADGYFKIVPPRGATLFISSDYVKFVEPRQRSGLIERYLAGGGSSESSTASSVVRSAPAGEAPAYQPAQQKPNPAPGDSSAMLPSDATRTEPAGEPVSASSTGHEPAGASSDGRPVEVDDVFEDADVTSLPGHGAVPKSKASSPPAPNNGKGNAGASGRYQAMLSVLESELSAEMRKPLEDRSLGQFKPRYEEIANQDKEYVPSEVAKIRLQQISDRVSLRDSRKALLDEREQVDAYRVKVWEDRMKRGDDRGPVEQVKYDLEGELRVSYAFGPDKRRFRLIDPQRGTTLAYVDIPQEVEANPVRFVGRYVGIKTTGKTYSPAARITVAVAGAVADLTVPPDMQRGPQAPEASRTDSSAMRTSRKSIDGPGDRMKPAAMPPARANDEPIDDDMDEELAPPRPSSNSPATIVGSKGDETGSR